MKAMKNIRSAHVFDLKSLKEFYLVFGIHYKNSFYSGNIIKKQLFYLVLNSYASTLIKWHPLQK